MSEIISQNQDSQPIKQTYLGKNQLFRQSIFQMVGTAILATGICCTKYITPISLRKQNPFHDQFISLSLYLAIVICSPFCDAHFNPAVSLAFWVRRQKQKRINGKKLLMFLVSQMIGAFIGTGFSQLVFGVGGNSNQKQLQTLFIIKQVIGQCIGGFIFIFFIFMVTHETTSFIVEKAWIKLFIPMVLFCARKDSFFVGGVNPAVMINMDLMRIFSGSNAGSQFVDVLYTCLGSLIGGCLAALFFQKVYLINVKKWRQFGKQSQS